MSCKILHALLPSFIWRKANSASAGPSDPFGLTFYLLYHLHWVLILFCCYFDKHYHIDVLSINGFKNSHWPMGWNSDNTGMTHVISEWLPYVCMIVSVVDCSTYCNKRVQWKIRLCGRGLVPCHHLPRLGEMKSQALHVRIYLAN